MEGVNMANKFGKFVSDLSIGTKKVLDKSKDLVVSMTDQNEDGKLGLDDVSIVAENVGSVVKKGAGVLSDHVGKFVDDMTLKQLGPLSKDAVLDPEFTVDKFIRVVNRDKRYEDNELTSGSVGSITEKKGQRLMTIFTDSLPLFDLHFIPDIDSEFYIVDPSDRKTYIALDEYFHYLKQARVSELQRIAQDLGAKHFRVTYKEQKASLLKKAKEGNIGAKNAASVSKEKTYEENSFALAEIAAEMDFPGHSPIMPKLKYLKNDPNITNLVEMRMNESTPLLHQRLLINLSVSSGIKEREAVKIDTVLKGLRCSGNLTLENEVQNESRRFLEYEIDF